MSDTTLIATTPVRLAMRTWLLHSGAFGKITSASFDLYRALLLACLAPAGCSVDDEGFRAFNRRGSGAVGAWDQWSPSLLRTQGTHSESHGVTRTLTGPHPAGSPAAMPWQPGVMSSGPQAGTRADGYGRAWKHLSLLRHLVKS